MSTIDFSCPQCGHTMKLPVALIGKKGKCPKCGMVNEVTNLAGTQQTAPVTQQQPAPAQQQIPPQQPAAPQNPLGGMPQAPAGPSGGMPNPPQQSSGSENIFLDPPEPQAVPVQNTPNTKATSTKEYVIMKLKEPRVKMYLGISTLGLLALVIGLSFWSYSPIMTSGVIGESESIASEQNKTEQQGVTNNTKELTTNIKDDQKTTDANAVSDAKAENAVAEQKRIAELLANRNDVVFRGLAFGDSVEIVKHIWSDVGLEGGDDYLYCESDLDGEACELSLKFYKDSLYEIRLSIRDIKYLDRESAVINHASLIDILSEKYGVPEKGLEPLKRGSVTQQGTSWDMPTFTIEARMLVGSSDPRIGDGYRNLIYLWKSPLVGEAKEAVSKELDATSDAIQKKRSSEL